MASLDPRYRLVAAVTCGDEKHAVQHDDLDTYLTRNETPRSPERVCTPETGASPTRNRRSLTCSSRADRFPARHNGHRKSRQHVIQGSPVCHALTSRS